MLPELLFEGFVRIKMTQEELAQKIYVSSKAISKWETGQGLPDISLLEPLAKALIFRL